MGQSTVLGSTRVWIDFGSSLLSVCRAFQSNDLIATWTRMLWNWLRDKDSIQEGFIRWNSRRVPIAEHNVELLIESVSELLELGLTLHPQPTLLNHATLELDSHLRTTCPPVQYMAYLKFCVDGNESS